MKKGRSIYFNGFAYLSLLIMIFFVLVSNFTYTSKYLISENEAYGHLTGTPGSQSNVLSRGIGSYVVLFQRIPSSAQGSDNSSLLRFSVMQNNQDIYGVFAALTIKEKGSNNISATFPYKFYELGDIDFRYNFQNAADHEVIFQARIAGDPQYQYNPLVASFDVPVITGVGLGNFALIIVVLVFIALPVGVIILILDFNKRMKRNSSTWK
jgi:hypothetical protein